MLKRYRSGGLEGWNSEVTIDLGKIVAIGKMDGAEGVLIQLVGSTAWLTLNAERGEVERDWASTIGAAVPETPKAAVLHEVPGEPGLLTQVPVKAAPARRHSHPHKHPSKNPARKR